MPKLYTISNEWSPQIWFNTGGTRAKKYLQSPDGKFYYFKRSQYKEPTAVKPGKDFIYEFWSEVIAYEVGTMLGFNVLRYDIAVDGEIMGCICESMVNSDNEELIEGIQYIKSFSPSFDPNIKEHKTWYTFDLIERSIKNASLEFILTNILEIIVFDAIIGNGDRHQENWAVINEQKMISDIIVDIPDEEINESNRLSKLIFKWVKNYYKRKVHFFQKKHEQKQLPSIFYTTLKRFAPIYDSGSSLGRELTSERIDLFLKSDTDMNRYIDNGLSEIHWGNEKLSHFDLISQLLQTNYGRDIEIIIERVLQRVDKNRISDIINTVDELVPDRLIKYKIPDNRKQFMIKLITLRIEKIRTLVHERV